MVCVMCEVCTVCGVWCVWCVLCVVYVLCEVCAVCVCGVYLHEHRSHSCTDLATPECNSRGHSPPPTEMNMVNKRLRLYRVPGLAI